MYCSGRSFSFSSFFSSDAFFSSASFFSFSFFTVSFAEAPSSEASGASADFSFELSSAASLAASAVTFLAASSAASFAVSAFWSSAVSAFFPTFAVSAAASFDASAFSSFTVDWSADSSVFALLSEADAPAPHAVTNSAAHSNNAQKYFFIDNLLICRFRFLCVFFTLPIASVKFSLILTIPEYQIYPFLSSFFMRGKRS